jgi:hypothetical protein
MTSLGVNRYARYRACTIMSPTIQNFPVAGSRIPYRSAAAPVNSRLNIAVIFTSIESTLSALRKAGVLAGQLHARITLIVPQVVPYPIPVDCPTVPLDFTERQFRVIAGASPIETRVRVYLCRDRTEVLRSVLKPHSLVVIGGNRHWWPTREKRLARQLRRSGHAVVFAEV